MPDRDLKAILDKAYGDPKLRHARELAEEHDPFQMPQAPPEMWDLDQEKARNRPGSGTLPAEKGAAEGLAGMVMTPYEAGRIGTELYQHAHEGDLPGAGKSLAEAALMLMPGRTLKGRQPALEQYVDYLKQRPSVFNYDKYLEDPLRVVGNRDRRMETMEPEWKRDPTQTALNLDHYRNLDRLRERRDAGMYEGPEGGLVNPWYWPGPIWHGFAEHLGPEMTDHLLGRYLDYNAASSPMTNVSRNALEGWHLLHSDVNGIPFDYLGSGVLSGMAFPNKLRMATEVGHDEGLLGRNAHKVRNYSLNLRGVGTYRPEYDFGTGERIISPTTLDSIMSEAMRLRTKAGDPLDTFKGPIYRHGEKTINNLGEEVGAASSDTQAGIWQAHQYDKHGDPVYLDSHARIVDDMIHQVAAHEGKSPQKVLEELATSTGKGPPNAYAIPAAMIPAGILLDYYYGGEGEGRARNPDDRFEGGSVGRLEEPPQLDFSSIDKAAPIGPVPMDQPKTSIEFQGFMPEPDEMFDRDRPNKNGTRAWGVGIRRKIPF